MYVQVLTKLLNEYESER